MKTLRLISLISDDHPGIVDAIAEKIADIGGSWLESRLSKLSGKFAGVIRVSIDSDKVEALETALYELSQQGIWSRVDAVSEGEPKTQTNNKVGYVHLLGPDRKGIVRELSKALVSEQINLSNLETSLSSMPYSGEPLFEATGELEIPNNVDIQAFHDKLYEIGDALALDISFSEKPFDSQ